MSNMQRTGFATSILYMRRCGSENGLASSVRTLSRLFWWKESLRGGEMPRDLLHSLSAIVPPSSLAPAHSSLNSISSLDPSSPSPSTIALLNLDLPPPLRPSTSALCYHSALSFSLCSTVAYFGSVKTPRTHILAIFNFDNDFPERHQSCA